MQPTIYIDVLFLLNFFMDTVILFSTSIILKKNIRIVRLLLAATLSSTYSVIMFFPELSFICCGFFKILFLVFITFIAFPAKTYKAVLKNAFVFAATNSIYGGVLFFLIFATDFGTTMGAVISNGEIYFNISFGVLLVSVILSFCVTALIAYIRKQNIQQQKNTVDLTIFLNNRHCHGKALCDTGCHLSDPLSGNPAIILSPQFAKNILSHRELTANNIDRYRILPYRTIDNQNGILHGFVPDKIKINETEVKNITAAISKNDFTGFDAIINSELAENINFGKAVTIKQ